MSSSQKSMSTTAAPDPSPGSRPLAGPVGRPGMVESSMLRMWIGKYYWAVLIVLLLPLLDLPFLAQVCKVIYCLHSSSLTTANAEIQRSSLIIRLCIYKQIKSAAAISTVQKDFFLCSRLIKVCSRVFITKYQFLLFSGAINFVVAEHPQRPRLPFIIIYQ